MAMLTIALIVVILHIGQIGRFLIMMPVVFIMLLKITIGEFIMLMIVKITRKHTNISANEKGKIGFYVV